MNLPGKIAFAFLMASIGLVSAYAQEAPCLKTSIDNWTSCPKTNTQDATLISNTNGIGYSLLESTAELENHTGARYKAFWILGDGQFRYFRDGNASTDALSLSLNYNYPKTGVFSPTVVFSEKKSNTTPPRKPKRNVNVTAMVAPPTAFLPQISPDSSMNIFAHERNRPKYPTVFVISSPAQDTNINGLFLFYNCIKIGPTGTFTRGQIHDVLESPELPSYFSLNPTNIVTRNTVADMAPFHFLEPFATGIQPFYQNFIYVPVSRTVYQNLPDGHSEVRIFPTLRSIWDQNWIQNQDTVLPESRYLSIAVGTQPRVGQGQVITPELQRLISEAQGYFPGIETPSLRISNNPSLYIRGIYRRDVGMVGSIDPNELTITQICPTNDGKYLVRMRMQVCNEGYRHESNFSFQLKDFTGVLSQPQFVGTPPIVLNDPNLNDKTWIYTWNVFLDGVPLPNATEAEKAEAGDPCTEAEFTVTTTWAGVQKLIQGNQNSLQLCVTFLNANPKCQFNSEVNAQLVTEAQGYSCEGGIGTGETDPKQNDCIACCFQYPVLGLLIIILFVLLWIVWMLRTRLPGSGRT